jgi:hypothetical protein
MPAGWSCGHDWRSYEIIGHVRLVRVHMVSSPTRFPGADYQGDQGARPSEYLTACHPAERPLVGCVRA